MRKYLIYIIGLILMFITGCASHRKVAEEITETSQSMATINNHSSAISYVRVDTTVTEAKATIITEISFGEHGDSANISSIILNKDGTINAIGNVKGVKQTKVSHAKTRNGDSEQKESVSIKENAVVTKDVSIQVQQASEPAKDPLRWRYIAIIIVTCSIMVILGYIKWKNSNIKTAILKYLSKLFHKS